MKDSEDVLHVLRTVPWANGVAKSFGNCHSTLIGAIIQAWNLSANDRFTLDGGCSPSKGHVGSRFCDAILCKGEPDALTPLGILEVELDPFPSQKSGKKPIFDRMARYWCTPENEQAQLFSEFQYLSFAVLV